MAAPEVRRLTALAGPDRDRGGDFAVSGPPLVYLHGPWGLAPDRAFVARLADGQHGLCAASFPAPAAAIHEAVHALDNWLDLVVYHGELFDKLELAAPALVGHSFGGLVAAEFAAAAPKSVGRLVLIDPVGLWRDDLPVKNWMLLSRQRAPARAVRRSRRRGGASAFSTCRAIPPRASTRLRSSSGRRPAPASSSGRSPIAASSKRAHRIAAPTLIVWGKADGIIAPAYAQEFAGRIAGARVELIDKAGHLPHLENSEAVGKIGARFSGGLSGGMQRRRDKRVIEIGQADRLCWTDPLLPGR